MFHIQDSVWCFAESSETFSFLCGKKIIAVLLERGSECIVNVQDIPYKLRKYKVVDSSPKTGSIDFTFGATLEIDASNIFLNG